jgi:branched-chain amino acid aminotransferase
MTGTAAELVPLREVDDHVIGEGVRGPVTTVLQRVFQGALRGGEPRYTAWLDHVEVPAATA